MTPATLLHRLLLAATGIPLGLALGVALEQWRPAPDAATERPAAAVVEREVAPDPLTLAATELRARRTAATAAIADARAEILRLDAQREANGLSRPQRAARAHDADPLVGDSHALGLTLDATELQTRRLAWRSEPAPPAELPRERWRLEERVPVGPVVDARLALLGDDATLLVLGRERLLLVDRAQRVVRAQAGLPAPPAAWAADEAGKQVLVASTAGHLQSWRSADGARSGVTVCDDGPALAAVAVTGGWAIATGTGVEVRQEQLLLRRTRPWPGEPARAATATRDGLIALANGRRYRWSTRTTGGMDAAPGVTDERFEGLQADPGARFLAWRDGDGTAVLDLTAAAPAARRLEHAPFLGWSSDGLVLTAAGSAIVARAPEDLSPRAVLQGASAPVHAGDAILATGSDPCVLWSTPSWLPLQALRGGHATLLALAVDDEAGTAISYHRDGMLWWWRRQVAP